MCVLYWALKCCVVVLFFFSKVVRFAGAECRMRVICEGQGAMWGEGS